MTENPPWLFIYFVPNIKVLKAKNNELWLCEIRTGNGIVLKLSTGLISAWDRHYITLPHGFWWSAITWHEPRPQEALLVFSPPNSHDAIFCIPEKYIARVYDMANRNFIYQRLPPNPPR